MGTALDVGEGGKLDSGGGGRWRKMPNRGEGAFKPMWTVFEEGEGREGWRVGHWGWGRGLVKQNV